MSSAQGPNPLEQALRSAVHDFAISIHEVQGAVVDISPLVLATNVLPLKHLAHWELRVRDEFSMARRTSRWAEPGRPLTWLDLASWDGHVREKTLRKLSGPAPNSFFLALAARRLNDWVPQVRQAAREAILTTASTSDPEHVVDVLCAMLPTWTSWGRAEDADKQAFLKLVYFQKVAEALARRVISAPWGPMPAVLAQALRTTMLDEHLAVIARQAIQPAVRAVAYRTLLAGKAVWVEGLQRRWTNVRYGQSQMHAILGERALEAKSLLLPTLEAAAADRAPAVRNVAAAALIQESSRLGGAALPLAHRLAADTSSRVAERGRFVLGQLGADSADAS